MIVGQDEYWSWERRDVIDRFGDRGGHLVLAGLEILAMGLSTNVEENHGHDAASLLLGEAAAPAAARIYYGSDASEHVAKARHGAGMIATFAKGKGSVFNAVFSEWVHGLLCHDPAVEIVTRNAPTTVLARR